MIEYPPSPASSSASAVKMSPSLDGFGMLVPEVEGSQSWERCFPRRSFEPRAGDHVTLTCYVGGTRAGPGSLTRTRTELVLADLRAILGVKGRPTFQHHCLFRKAIPQYEIGFGRFKKLMNEIEAKSPGLFMAGHYRDGISLGDSIVSAHGVVERIENFLAQDSSVSYRASRDLQPQIAA
jgi:oxygen-dependent protoporphyrinogen oxidase